MKVLLFDMDGVLIHARAYHRALQDTVSMVGEALGYKNVDLRVDVIELIESVGITSEWDSAAICCALLLKDIWQMSPLADLPKHPPLPRIPKHDLPMPDFRGFFNSQRMSDHPDTSGLLRAEAALLKDGGYLETQVESVRSLLRGARFINGSITHRLFQEFVLGSDVFKMTYGFSGYLHVEGYLLSDDQPALSSDRYNQLLDWLDQEGHRAVVFTNRPSKPPPGYFDTPEAELGLSVVGLESLPLIGRGGLAWVAERRGLEPEIFLKPSPVHVLAALCCAMGFSREEALNRAVSLVVDQKMDEKCKSFSGAEVYVFEDSIKGFRSAQQAADIFSHLGVTFQLHLIGVSDSEEKQHALRLAGAKEVFGNLDSALSRVL